MADEYLLSDIVQGTIDLDTPEQVKDILSDIYKLSLNYPETVIDIKIATYEPEADKYRLYFGWAVNKDRSSNVAYIAYDKQRDDFFNWLVPHKSPRYNPDQLMDYFKNKFSKQTYQ